MPCKGFRRVNRNRDEQRAAWKAMGLTCRGTPRKKRLSEMTPHERAARRMVEGKRAAKALAQQNAADRQDAERRAQLAHENHPHVVLYREAKAEATTRQQRLLADAKREFERQMAQLDAARKGGRPRKAKGLAAQHVVSHPADALVRTLRPLREMGA